MEPRGALCLGLVAGVWTALALAGCNDPTADLDSDRAEEVIRALRACAQSGDEQVVDRVASVVTHPDVMVAGEAVRTLGRLRNPKAVEVLKELAAGARDKRSAVRVEAVTQLGRRLEAREEVLPVLRQALKVDPDPRVRAAAATSIAKQRSLNDVALLVEVAENETDPVVQARAVGAVEQLVGLKFGYNPAAPKAEREAALRRMRRLATTAAAAMKRYLDQKARGG